LNTLVTDIEYDIGFVSLNYLDFYLNDNTFFHFSKGKTHPTERKEWIEKCKINNKNFDNIKKDI